MKHASVSIYIADSETGEAILEHNAGKSLTPASIMKLITSAAAIELLGPEYTFKTVVGYTGTLNKKTGTVDGDIVIKGGGDPSLGSDYFADHYKDFMDGWVSAVRKTGIIKVNGRVITDDSYYDFQPVPAKWLWEDAGNYYGAGVYGLSVFDNVFEIQFKEGKDSFPVIKSINPSQYEFSLENRLIAFGTTDRGYVFSAPYSNGGWLEGSIPKDLENFVLKASIADPPLLIARMFDEKLRGAGITLSGEPATTRLTQLTAVKEFTQITEIVSPSLSEIIEVLNHESVNLYAEHLIKELGKKFLNSGSIDAGIRVVEGFLNNTGINSDGMFIVDGSGLSPANSINAFGLAGILLNMKQNGKYFSEFYNSLPEVGKEGTLVNYFTDPLFDKRLRAKSGSMTRVRSFAGYFSTRSNRDMVFAIIVNNYTGSSRHIVTGIENIISQIILEK